MTDNNPQLAAEQLLAVVGLESILRAKPRYNQETQRNADAFLPRARKQLLQFLSGTKAKVQALPDFDFEDVSDLLNNVDETHNAALFAAIPDDVQDDVLAAATNIVNALQPIVPRYVTKTTVKADVQPAAPMALGRFERVWSVALDPTIVLRDLLEGSVDPVMVAAFKQLYPALYDAVAGEGGLVDDAIATMKSRRGDNWDLDHERDQLLKTFLGQDTIDLGLAADMAQASKLQTQEQEASPKARSVNAKLTDAERLPSQKP